MRKNQRIAIAAICCVVLTLVRLFFIALFFITSVLCIVIAESRVERCEGHVTLSQMAVDSLNTTSTFVETVVSSFVIFLIYRWKQFNFKNFLKALPRQGDFWMWTILWVARILTNVLIDIIPGINQNYPVLVVLGFSLTFEFASTTILACAFTYVNLHNVKSWFAQHFSRERADKLLYLYRAILFTYGLRMLALFLYDSFLVARQITRQSEYRELDSVLLALDVGYRGSLAVFFFRKFFDFAVPQVFEETNSKSNCQLTSERLRDENKEIASCSEIALPETLETTINVAGGDITEEEASVFKDKSTEKVEYSTGKDYAETNEAYNVSPEASDSA